MNVRRFVLCFGVVCFLTSRIASAQATMGLLQHEAGSLDNGYVLFAPTPSTTTYLIDKCGRIAHTWLNTHQPGQSVYLLPDGTLLRTAQDTANNTFNSGGKGGIVQKINWDG